MSKINSPLSQTVYLSDFELKRLGKTSELCSRKRFSVRKTDLKKVCNECSKANVLSEFSKKIGNSTLKRHLKSKHPDIFEFDYGASEMDNFESENSEDNQSQGENDKIFVTKKSKIMNTNTRLNR